MIKTKDDQLAIQKQESELEWENSFTAKRGESHTILHLSKDEGNDDDLPYLKLPEFKRVAAQIISKHEEQAFPSTSEFGYPQGKGKTFSGEYGEYHNSQWTLPPAWTESGVMLVLPADSGLWSKVIFRWESITINRLNNQTWPDNKAKLAFVENLLGESEKVMWKQWRTMYPDAYSALEAIADELQNITSQVRQLIMLEDPYHGSTDEQDRAYRDLDRITCEEIKNLWSFLEDFRKNYGIRKSRTYKGKPHNSHVKPFKRKYKDDIGRDIVSADFDDSNVYSISEGESDTHQSISVMVQDIPVEEATFMTIKESDENDNALKIIEQLKSKKIRLEEQKDEEIRELKAQLQKEKEKQTQVQEEFPPLRNSQTTRPCIETEVHYSGNATASPKVRKITNQLYNVKVEFDTSNCPTFGTTAIIDIGASACCINKKVIPEEALEPLTQIVFFNGLNSKQQATHRLKQGSFLIEGNKFKIPLIYAFDMRDRNGIKMLIGDNFLRSMKGGIRIERGEITIYKKVTRIKTLNQTEIAEIAELEVNEEEFREINESIYFNQEGSKIFLEQFKPIIERLKHQGYIEDKPLKHWKKNGELCKLDIINPDITVEDRPLKHVTPAMED
ncbi:Orf y [Tanacetum coccineum]